MRRLDLDFAPRRRSRTAWLLLAVAVLLAIDSGLAGLDLLARRERAQQPVATARTAPPDSAATAAAQRVIDHLARPWPALLATIEAAAADAGSVRLLALEPDAERGTVRIAGEATQPADILAFLRQLERGGPLRGAHLLSQRPAAGSRLEFVVLARWESAR